MKIQNSNLHTNFQTIDMLLRILEIEHDNKNNPPQDAVYRNLINKTTKYQRAWMDYLLQYSMSVQLTITLPRKGIQTKIRNKSVVVYKLSKNQYKSMDMYKEFLRELEIIFTGSNNNWPRKAFKFKGVIEEKDKNDPVWHIHLLIQNTSDNKICFLYRLCWSIQKLIEKYGFEDNVVNVQTIYNEKGIVNYICKEIKNPRNLFRDEGSYIFDLTTLFKIKEEKIKPIKFHPFYKHKIILYLGLYLKEKGWLKACTPNSRFVHKCQDRRQFEIDVLPYFDSLYFWI